MIYDVLVVFNFFSQVIISASWSSIHQRLLWWKNSSTRKHHTKYTLCMSPAANSNAHV